MTFLKPSARAVAALRDDLEVEVARAAGRAVRRFLAQVRTHTVAAVRSPVGQAVTAAAGAPEPLDGEGFPTLGLLYGWWAEQVDGEVIGAIAAAVLRARQLSSDTAFVSTGRDAAHSYLARVSDRLVRGLVPPIAEDSFDRIRVAVSRGALYGWDTQQVADRIAADLSWDRNSRYWRSALAEADAAIDAILDPLGPPGAAAREYARLNDPRVRALQADRARYVALIDADRSHWQTRAAAIARTESTAAANYGTLSALADEGVARKEWLAAGDSRTRPSHAAASGQVVPLVEPFRVGDVLMIQPGDPSAPADEVVNCRCTLLGVHD